MIKYKKGYKVVMKRTLRSCSMVTLFGSVKYKVNEWVNPVKGFGPLCVFNYLFDAKRFNFYASGTIYECLYEPNLIASSLHLYDLPPWTILASKVKLIKRVG